MSGRIILPPEDFNSQDTTAGDIAVTLNETIGKHYLIANTGTGSNQVNITYGSTVFDLDDGYTFSAIYDGTTWTVLSGHDTSGSFSELTTIGEKTLFERLLANLDDVDDVDEVFHNVVGYE